MTYLRCGATVARRPIPVADRDVNITVSIRLSGYFDKSGKFKDHAVISFCGLVSHNRDWDDLQIEWDSLLLRHGIASLHMSGGALNYKRSLSSKSPALGKPERINVIRQFIAAIKKHIEVAVIAVVDVAGYRSLPEHYKNEIGGDDPYFWAFSSAMAGTLAAINAIPGSKVNVVCDDEEKYFIQCYKLLTRFKLREPILKDKFVSISAADDREFPQLQAADLLAYIARCEAGRKFLDKDYDFTELFDEFNRPAQPGEKLVFINGGLFWSKENLTEYVARNLAKRKKSKSVK